MVLCCSHLMPNPMRLNSMYELSNEQRLKFTIVLMEYLNAGDWKGLFTETGCEEFAQQHTQFYEDVSWENETLEQDCTDAVEFILKKDSGNLKVIWDLPGVQIILSRKDEDLHREIEALIESGSGYASYDVDSVAGDIFDMSLDTSSLNTSSLNTNPVVLDAEQNPYKALDEAESLLDSQGSASAYDLMHAALDSFLSQLCTEKGISFDKSDSNLILLSKLNDFIKTKAGSELNDKTLSMLRIASVSLDTINDLKNQHSSSLSVVDTKFAINLARSVMSYVDEQAG